MKNLLLLILVCLVALSQSFSQAFYSENIKKIWETDAVFMVPESVIYDPVNDIIYVSNINGDPTEEDSNGFISKLGIDGNVVELEWITGLNAPKGMGIDADTLFVADVNRVVKIDTRLEEIIAIYNADSAIFLNDITIDDQGRVFISDLSLGSIYILEDDKIEVFLPKGTFNRCNGLQWFNNELYVGTKGMIKSVNLENKRHRDVVEVDGGIDGLEIWHGQYFVFSDWAGKVQVADLFGNTRVLFNTTSISINAADIEVIGKSDLLLVPTFFDNRVMAYQIME
jgi:DNA-binding beta-propeller fold protein YncE